MMFKRNPAIAAVTAAALALTAAGTAPAFAAGKPQTETSIAKVSDVTDFSAGKRHDYYRGYRNHHGNAAAIAAFTAIVGGIAAYAAAREYRKAQERRYGYDGEPYGYGGPRYW